MSRIEDLERRLARDPGSKIFAQLAEEYRRAGRLEDAIETCRIGLESHPNYSSARVALARALLESGAWEEASREFETVLAQVPDNILANKFLGQTYEQLGRAEDALAKYRVAQTLAPGDADIAERIRAVEAVVARGVSVPTSPPLPEEPTPLSPEDELEAVPPVPLIEDPSAFEPEGQLLEPTLTEDESFHQPEGEAVFDLENFEEKKEEDEKEKPPSTIVRRQAAEIGESFHVSEEAQAFQKEFEESYPTGVVKRQQREILDSAGSPPSYLPESMEAPEEARELQGHLDEEVGSSEPPAASPAGFPEASTSRAAPETGVEGPRGPEQAGGGGMSTATLAELYASQGHLEQALSVYRELLAAQRNDIKIRRRVEELTMLVHAQAEAGSAPASRAEGSYGAELQAVRGTIRRLEGWLAAIRRS